MNEFEFSYKTRDIEKIIQDIEIKILKQCIKSHSAETEIFSLTKLSGRKSIRRQFIKNLLQSLLIFFFFRDITFLL